MLDFETSAHQKLPTSGPKAKAQHPVLCTASGAPGWQSKTVPLSLHGDGTPVSGIGKGWCRMMDIFSMSSLMAAGSTLDFTIFLYAVYTQLLTKLSTNTLWHILCWSFRALASGKWPAADAFGRPYTSGVDAARANTDLADGYRGVLFVIRGDLDYYGNTLHLNHHGSKKPCSWCPANSEPGDPLNWAEFRRSHRLWHTELWEHDEWIEAHPARHLLFQLSGTSVKHVYVDWMHTKHMGVDACLYSSVLWLLVFKLLPGFTSPLGFGFVQV